MTTTKLPGLVTFEISDTGEPSVGIMPSMSSVTTHVSDSEHLEWVRTELKTAFTAIHDMPVCVVTVQEREASDKAEALQS